VVLPQEGSWTALTGVMLPVDQPLLDLIPVAQQRSRSEQVAQRGRLVTMGLALGVLLMIAVGLQIDIQQHRTVQVRLEQQVQSAAPRVAQLKRALARMHQAQDVLAAQYSMASFLQDLYERTPSEITLRQWLHDTNRTIRIAGHTSALSMVLAYVSRLDDSPYLQDVQLRYSSKRETRQGMQVDFELVGQVTGQAR
jgi:hypothetical protein